MIKLKEYNDCTKDPLSTNVYVMCEGLFLGYSAHHKSYNYGYEHRARNMCDGVHCELRNSDSSARAVWVCRKLLTTHHEGTKQQQFYKSVGTYFVIILFQKCF